MLRCSVLAMLMDNKSTALAVRGTPCLHFAHIACILFSLSVVSLRDPYKRVNRLWIFNFQLVPDC
jgi:hypothetical protein